MNGRGTGSHGLAYMRRARGAAAHDANELGKTVESGGTSEDGASPCSI